jgi:ribonucleoside-diphosphate reductase alpha chain
MQVIKRNGEKETFSVEKIHKVVQWATNNINGVSFSDIEMNANLSLYDGVSSSDIHQILIKSANDLISRQAPNYQYVAARLLNMQLRKEVWKSGSTPPSFQHLLEVNVDSGMYDPHILKKWSKGDIDTLGKYINHSRDDQFTYAGLQQLIDKYLVKNRGINRIYETPQFAYMCIAMCLFDNIDEVKKAYDCYSTFKINLPTPIMAGVRTNIRQFASCVLVDVDDNLDAIFSSIHAVGKYTARRAGIGLNIGRMRPINSPIRGGEVIHTGLIPYLKNFESAVKSTSQNGLRGGSATVHVPFWHYEIEDIMVLKNNAGTDDNRVRKLDYSVQFCKLFYERLLNNEDVTLFSPHEAKGLYEAFGDNEKFEELYLKYENARSFKFKKKVPARKLAEVFARERLETGRIYSMNIDSANEHYSLIYELGYHLYQHYF